MYIYIHINIYIHICINTHIFLNTCELNAVDTWNLN
jgi:hypothetical protein